MATLFKEVNYNLQTLINNIDIGLIGLPDIQRPFVWKDSKVRDLFDSMYKGYPVGYLLFWANGFDETARTIGTHKKQRHPSLLIVDGQQRLTSLYAVVKGVEVIRENFAKEKIVIAFHPIEEKFVVADAAINKSAEYVHNISDLWNDDTNVYDFIEQFITTLSSNRQITPEEDRKIKDSLGKLSNLQSYPFSALELSPEINEEQVADVFVRINSEGKSLNNADFILTIMSVFWEEGRKELEEFCEKAHHPTDGEATPYNHFIVPKPDQLLRIGVGLAFHRARLQFVYSILRGKDLETGEFSTERREEQFKKLGVAQDQALNLTNWHEFFKSVQSAGYISGEMISSTNTLLYSYVFFLIGKYQYSVEHYRLRKLISKWFMMTSLKGRYTGSPETIMEIDLAKLRTISDADQFVALLENIIEGELTSDFWSIELVNDLATSSSRSPSLFAYYAGLNILNAPGLFSNLKVSELLQAGIRSNKSALERHHLFPKAYLHRIGITALQDTNQIANFALVEWSDNIDISDQKPSEYISAYKARFSENELQTMYKLHGLPKDWENMEYADFIEERRKNIASVIHEAYKKIES
ncbi:MAG: DUF262 domain-containing protein [Candidatus Microsaccharimonas sossegonensis]|uniref:DUF262 domain-containing protein n=1 Tax=Candidatus Microsaccharimonas sossegonensis TaxID=2506948 RepID=A0A4Q0AGX2_9BACT|nr:MAG: DUF262 domain-containing protein [Candidatus Microsaccharimonas sossegonensis]